jgi:hypothetical protein
MQTRRSPHDSLLGRRVLPPPDSLGTAKFLSEIEQTEAVERLQNIAGPPRTNYNGDKSSVD